MRIVSLCLLLTVALVGNVFGALSVYTYEMTEAHLRLMMQNPLVSPTPSCDSALALDGYEGDPIANFVIGTTPGNDKDNPAFPNSSSYNDCPPHNIYAYMISDPCSTGPKVNIVIMSGIHGSESSGTWTFQGMEDFCASDELAAINLRKIANIFVYPNANPDGRYLKHRGNPELARMISDGLLPAGTAWDMNRIWHLYDWGLSTIDALVPAIKADTGGQAEYFFDYHGGSSQGASWFYCDPTLYDNPFTTEFEALKAWVPGEPHPVEHTNIERPGDYRMTRIWAMRADTLNARFGCTPENTGVGTPQDRFNLGRAYGLAVYNTMTKGDPRHDYNKLNIEAQNWLANNLISRQGSLLARWKFDEGSGSTAFDSSGNNYNGTITGAAWVNNSVRGNVLDFEGVDYISLPPAAFSSVSDQVTIALWQYGDVAIQPQNDTIFEGVNDSGTRVLSSNLPWGSGTVYFDAGASGSSYDRISKSATANQYEGRWNHWAFTKNTSTGQMKMYLNGQLWHSLTGMTSSMSGITAFKIGSKTDNTSNYDGMISDFRAYNYELLEDEISQIYQDGEAQLPPPGQQIICQDIPEGDLNEDCLVNYLDFAILASGWLQHSVVEEGILSKQYFSNNESDYEFVDATWSHNLGGGDNRILIVALGQEGDNFDDMEVDSITFNRVQMKPVPDSEVTAGYSGGIKLKFYYLLEQDLPQPGFYPVSVTYAGSVLQRLGGSISRSAVVQQAPVCLATNSIAGPSSISTNITAGENGWIVDAVACDGEGSFTTTSGGMTELCDVSGADGGTTLAASSMETSGSATMSWQYNSGTNLMIHTIIECELLN